MTSEWDRYVCRYDGSTQDTSEGFVEPCLASYDAATDTYTVIKKDGRPSPS